MTEDDVRKIMAAKSYFSGLNKTLREFPDLDDHSKKAIIWRWAIDCENDFQDKIEKFLTANLRDAQDLNESEWAEIIDLADVHFTGCYFLCFEVPVQVFTDTLLSKQEDLSEDFESWSEYREFYGTKDVKDYPPKNRWPVLSALGDSEIVEDGWHRLHSYINAGHSTIPVVEYSGLNDLLNEVEGRLGLGSLDIDSPLDVLPEEHKASKTPSMNM